MQKIGVERSLQYRERSDRMPHSTLRARVVLLSTASGRSARGTVILALLLSLIVLGSIASSAQKGRERFDPNGTFWIIGDPPTEFSDFSSINLNARRVRRLPASGLQLNNGRLFRFTQLTVQRQKFTFTTTQVRGVSYSFSGRFLKGGVYSETVLDEQSPVLEGVLTKFKLGKKESEAKLKFGYFGGT